jgi:hypothetical protein
MRTLETAAMEIEDLAGWLGRHGLCDLSSSLWMAAIAVRLEWIATGEDRAGLEPNLNAIANAVRLSNNPEATALAALAIKLAESE